MTDELRAKIIAYNKRVARKTEMAADMEILAAKLFGLLEGLSALLPDEVKAVLRKYGYDIE